MDVDRHQAVLAQLSALDDLTPAVGMLRSTRPVLISGRGWGGKAELTLLGMKWETPQYFQEFFAE